MRRVLSDLIGFLLGCVLLALLVWTLVDPEWWFRLTAACRGRMQD